MNGILDDRDLRRFKDRRIMLYDTSFLINRGADFIRNLSDASVINVVPDFIFSQFKKVTDKEFEINKRNVSKILRERSSPNLIVLMTPFRNDYFSAEDYVIDKRFRIIISKASTRANVRNEDGSIKRKVDNKDAMLLTLYYLLLLNGYNVDILTEDRKMHEAKEEIRIELLSS
ncbi:MAG: hypothetical protein ACP5GH_00225 [Nitrososphaeria archaeon]